MPIYQRKHSLEAIIGTTACTCFPTFSRDPISSILSGTSSNHVESSGINRFTIYQRWLLEQERDDEARAVVHRLYDAHTLESKEAAEREFIEMRDVIRAEASQRSRNLTDLWATRAMLKRTLVAVGVQVFGQFSGINGMSMGYSVIINSTGNVLYLVINYFGPEMYKALGLSDGQSLLVQGIYGAVGPITNFL